MVVMNQYPVVTMVVVLVDFAHQRM